MAAAEEEVGRLAEFFEGLNVEEHRSMEVEGGIAGEFSADRHRQMRVMLDLILHASCCNQPLCPYPNCRKVKVLFRHVAQCEKLSDGGCYPCWVAWTLLVLHAKECQESECIVPRCRYLKELLVRRQQQQQLQEQQGQMQLQQQQEDMIRQQ